MQLVHDVFAERVRNKSAKKKIRDPAGIQTQDLLNTSQTLTIKPLGPLTEVHGRGAEDKLHKQHCLEASAEFQLILTPSKLD